MAEGRIVQIVGAVVDVEFPPDDLPPLYNALELDTDAGDSVVLEVEQHIGDSTVRCVSMRPTEGLRRGTSVRDTGGPIRVPVGPETLGRVFDVTGEPSHSVLCGFDSTGMPIGLMISGHAFDETTILRVGHAYEELTSWHKKRPPIN